MEYTVKNIINNMKHNIVYIVENSFESNHESLHKTIAYMALQNLEILIFGY